MPQIAAVMALGIVGFCESGGIHYVDYQYVAYHGHHGGGGGGSHAERAHFRGVGCDERCIGKLGELAVLASGDHYQRYVGVEIAGQ